VEPFARYVRGFNQLPLRRPVFSPILGRYYEPDDPLGDLLSQQLVHPVDFQTAIRTLFKDGFRCFVEAGGKSTLTKLVAKILAGEDVETLSTLFMANDQLTLSGTLSRLQELGYRSAPSWPVTLTDMLKQARVPSGTPERYAEFWAAQGAAVSAEVAGHFERWLAVQLPAMATQSATDDASAAAQASPTKHARDSAATDRSTLFEQVSQIYAEALEYPVDVFAEGALLEAELGIDSVKQIEMLTRVWSEYDLPPRQDSFNLSKVDTLDKVVDHLADELTAKNSGSGAAAE
jgi:acyl transferase domain-containing protein